LSITESARIKAASVRQNKQKTKMMIMVMVVVVVMMVIIIIIQFFIINMPNQRLQGQLTTQHGVNSGNHIKDKHNIKIRDKLKASTGERKHINTEKRTNKNKDEKKYAEKT
jgi:flagellar biosynthesis/type III secretory pathway M-ring protein FliF/YscJ